MNKLEVKNKYITYVDGELNEIYKTTSELPDNIRIKKQHGLSMMDAVEKTTESSNLFNETYFESSAIEGLLHDIGRFEQFKKVGTLDDKVLDEKLGFKDHGVYGRYLLLKDNKKLLRYFLTDESFYDFILTEVIGEHTTIQNENYKISINSLKNGFKDYSLNEIINSKSKEKINELIALKLKILQEVDSLELLQNVISGAWRPTISDKKEDFIPDEIWNDFINFRYIDMSKYKKNGLWTVNAGFLLRYGLLTHKVNFVGTLKQFKDDENFKKLWIKTILNMDLKTGDFDPRLNDAQKYIKLAVDNLIKTSEDGLLITPESREKAKQLSLNSIK